MAKHRTLPGVWHGYLRGVGAGQRYGFRVSGAYRPNDGHCFNSAKLLLDPYAKAIEGSVDWAGPVFGSAGTVDDAVPDVRDSAPHMPYSVVVEDTFDWGDDRRPRVPWADTVIYEAHVRGFTKQHAGISDTLRGSYAAMGSEAVISYLKDLGVTTVQLLTVHHFVSEQALVRRGLTNYWGYNPIGFFAPEASYSSTGTSGEQVLEFKEMVRNLHGADIEVILDMCYNHTGEGNHHGPHLCFRGIDNRAYYRLERDHRYYKDYSGCGNTLNVREPQVLALIANSLRYWAEEMHIDGFRFDLASALARNLYADGRLGAFFDLIRQDPVVSQLKLIAESWNVGEDGGYQVDDFPALWAEHNDDYRDAVREFWRGAPQSPKRLARRLTGSTDTCRGDGRSPGTSINFVTWHDGFTLHDLVSYNRKHNEANGEGNRDGVNENLSWNCGHEGPTDDPTITELRERQKRNFLCCLLLSAGVPALYGGDELGRGQHGNNNPYCHDSELNWINWTLDPPAEALLQFTQQITALRAAHPVFRRRKPFQGREINSSGTRDVSWFTSDGKEMKEDTWDDQDTHVLGMFLNGQAAFDRATSGERIADDSFLLLLNGGNEGASFTLPGPEWVVEYEQIIDTYNTSGSTNTRHYFKSGKTIQIQDHSMIVLRAIT